MEPIFVNNTRMDAASCREFLALTWSRNAGFVRIILIIVAVLAGVYGVVQLFLGEPALILYAVLMFVMAALAIFLASFGYLFRLKRYTKEQFRLWGGPALDKEVRFYEDYFVQESDGQMRFLYTQVTKVKFGRKGVLLFFGDSALIMDRWGFGSAEKAQEFKDFIRRKTQK